MVRKKLEFPVHRAGCVAHVYACYATFARERGKFHAKLLLGKCASHRKFARPPHLRRPLPVSATALQSLGLRYYEKGVPHLDHGVRAKRINLTLPLASSGICWLLPKIILCWVNIVCSRMYRYMSAFTFAVMTNKTIPLSKMETQNNREDV